MTFKDIRIWSRSMTYQEIANWTVRCFENGQYIQSCAYNSMFWLNLFPRDRPYNKIRDWMYALQAYRDYKSFKIKHPDESLKIKTKRSP